MKYLKYLIVSLLILGCSNDEVDEQIQKFTIEITTSNGGSVSCCGGITRFPQEPLGGTFVDGSSISLIATADSEYVFVNWSNGSTDNPLSITVNSNLSITANFERNTYSDFPLNPIITTDNLFENDEFYGVLNDESTPEDYIRIFLLDSKRHGLELPEYEEYDIELIYNEDDPLSYGGWAGRQCELYGIRIGINSVWDNILFNGRDITRPEWVDYLPYFKLKLMYHELGHTFGLDHTCLSEGHIMSGDDGSGCVGVGEIDIDNFVGMWTLKYNASEELYDWERAVSDMFNKVDQNFFECKNGDWIN